MTQNIMCILSLINITNQYNKYSLLNFCPNCWGV